MGVGALGASNGLRAWSSPLLANPAVTLGFAVAGRFPWRYVLPYWAAVGGHSGGSGRADVWRRIWGACRLQSFARAVRIWRPCCFF